MKRSANPISCIVPVYNEEEYLATTLSALRRIPQLTEIIVVDDGSRDNSPSIGRQWGDRVIKHSTNLGKGAALYSGMNAAKGDIVLFIDADLGLSAKHAYMLLPPLQDGHADMSIAVLPPARTKGGVGMVKKLAGKGIERLTGYRPTAPLSGQRALNRHAMNAIHSWDCGFGIEVGMTIDVLRSGGRIHELEVPFSHRETGRDLRGFLHRGKRFWSVGQILQGKWRSSHG